MKQITHVTSSRSCILFSFAVSNLTIAKTMIHCMDFSINMFHTETTIAICHRHISKVTGLYHVTTATVCNSLQQQSPNVKLEVERL